MLPQATALMPADKSMASTSWVTVVFPFVPVMQIQFDGIPCLSLSRQARSISVQTAAPRAVAAASKWFSGLIPGEMITSSGLKAFRESSWFCSSTPIRDSTPRTSRTSTNFSSALSAMTSTFAPSSCKVSAAENPDTPKPKTKTLSSDQSEFQLVNSSNLLM